MPFVAASAHDNTSIIKRRIADLLGRFRTESSASMLKFLLKDEHKGVVVSSIAGLGKNPYFDHSAFLDFSLKTFRDAAVISLKSVFYGWETLKSEKFTEIGEEIPSSLEKTFSFVKEKTVKRKDLTEVSKETEKIKKILTETVIKCKL